MDEELIQVTTRLPKALKDRLNKFIDVRGLKIERWLAAVIEQALEDQEQPKLEL
jgi:hypothetical protein